MRFLVIFILAMALLMTSCGIGETVAINSDIINNVVAESAVNNVVDDDLTATVSQDQAQAEQEVIIANPYLIYERNNREKGLTPMDFEGAYQLCQDAVSDYFADQANNNFDKYIENSQLKAYISQSAEWSKPNREINKIGLSNAEFHNDESTGNKWFFFHVFIEFADGGETVEIIVKESADSKYLVIADWYILSPLYMDDQTRSHQESISNPDIWEDLAFADDMLKKAQEILN